MIVLRRILTVNADSLNFKSNKYLKMFEISTKLTEEPLPLSDLGEGSVPLTSTPASEEIRERMETFIAETERLKTVMVLQAGAEEADERLRNFIECQTKEVDERMRTSIALRGDQSYGPSAKSTNETGHTWRNPDESGRRS